MIFSVDFDGTIHDGDWYNIGEVKDNCLDFLRERQMNYGDKVILNTCRDGEPLSVAMWWLLYKEFYPDAVNENIVPHLDTSRKIYADIYIDDKNAEGINWNKIYEKFDWSI